jgi:hypothetical protein
MEYPTLTPAQQVVADRKIESLAENANKTDLDLLKEELQRIIKRMEAE